jgi:hypothetical protein
MNKGITWNDSFHFIAPLAISLRLVNNLQQISLYYSPPQDGFAVAILAVRSPRGQAARILAIASRDF